MSEDVQNQLKAQNIVNYLQGDFDLIEYRGKILEKVFLNELDENKIILYTNIIEEIQWNNKVLKNIGAV